MSDTAFGREGKRRVHTVTKEDAMRLSYKELKARLDRCEAYEAYLIERCDCDDAVIEKGN